MEIISIFDNNILNFIQTSMRCTFLDWLMPAVTVLGDNGAVWILIAAVLLFMPKHRTIGIQMSVALILCLLIGNIGLKPLVARARPFSFNTDIVLLIKPPADFSFPSGHTMASFAAASVIWLNNKKYGTAALLFASVIAFSRLYLYVHYPTDVLGGMIIGIIIAVLSVGFVNKTLVKS